MLLSESPCLNLAITQLKASGAGHYAVWVIKAPYPGGYVHNDCIWSETLTQLWHAWQEMFSLRGLPTVPRISSVYLPLHELVPAEERKGLEQKGGYSGRLMQHLGINLWQWLFDGAIQGSLHQSQGIAIGQNRPLRLRLEIRDPNLVAIPWEIMQPQAGKQAISLSQQLLFSRTTSDVDPLPALQLGDALNVLLILGQDLDTPDPDAGINYSGQAVMGTALKLEQEAKTLAEVLQVSGRSDLFVDYKASVVCHVDTLVQPTPSELTKALETNRYNIFFYAGHGRPAPNGGQLLLRSDTIMSGTELAQVLTRCRVTLAVFNACWSAQPDQEQHQAMPRSSLAEVLIHHGVPAVLGMRDSIADQEALSFIQAFARALADRLPIDLAMAVARQHLLTLYKFNQPAWTLPVLYMHPEFDGELLRPIDEGTTELPRPSLAQMRKPIASLVLIGSKPTKVWQIQGGIMRVGRRSENDLVIQEQWVSQRHAEIFCRDPMGNGSEPTYFLRDFSRYGTLVLGIDGWQKVHRQEITLRSGTQLKFGSSQGQTLEFQVEMPKGSDIFLPDDTVPGRSHQAEP